MTLADGKVVSGDGYVDFFSLELCFERFTLFSFRFFGYRILDFLPDLVYKLTHFRSFLRSDCAHSAKNGRQLALLSEKTDSDRFRAFVSAKSGKRVLPDFFK